MFNEQTLRRLKTVSRRSTKKVLEGEMFFCSFKYLSLSEHLDKSYVTSQRFLEIT